MLRHVLRLPPVMFLLWLVVASLVQRFVPLPLGLASFRIGLAIGGAIVLIALAIAATALLQFRRHRTTVEPWQRPSALMTSGIFRLTRNPLYISLLLVLLGIAVMANALWIAIAVPCLWLTLDLAVVRGEERIVEAVFGDEYREYKRRVRRWL